MRKPNLKDVFLLSKITRKIGIKELDIDAKESAEEVGKKVIFFLLENLDKAEEEITELIAGLLEISPEELLLLSIDEIYKRFKGMDGLSDFFTQVLKSSITRQSNLSPVVSDAM